MSVCVSLSLCADVSQQRLTGLSPGPLPQSTDRGVRQVSASPLGTLHLPPSAPPSLSLLTWEVGTDFSVGVHSTGLASLSGAWPQCLLFIETVRPGKLWCPAQQASKLRSTGGSWAHSQATPGARQSRDLAPRLLHSTPSCRVVSSLWQVPPGHRPALGTPGTWKSCWVGGGRLAMWVRPLSRWAVRAQLLGGTQDLPAPTCGWPGRYPGPFLGWKGTQGVPSHSQAQGGPT